MYLNIVNGFLLSEWDKSNIFAFGARSAQHLDDLKRKMSAYNCRNVICMKDDFLNSDPDDPKFKNVKVSPRLSLKLMQTP